MASKKDVAELVEDDSMEDDDFEGADQEIVNQFFWSLVVQPGKKYTQTLPYNLHINHVSLDENAKDGSKSILFCETDDGVSHPICILRAGVNDQMSLNLLFPSDGRLCLRSSPNSAVIHLLGYCEELENPSDFDDEEDDDISEEGEEGSEDDEEEEEDKEVEVKQPELKKEVKRKEAPTPAPETPAKKAKLEQPATPAPPPKKKETPVPKSQSQPSVAQPAKPAEKKAEPKKEAPAPKVEKEDPLGVQKKLGMGVTYTVSQRGQGAKATPGKKVNVQYRGWLKKGGKEFDKGKIQFRLGLGEVIKGWDIGVEGMQVGEKRTLTIPAPAGYGKRGAPPSIPPNADLQFDVTLLNVQ